MSPQHKNHLSLVHSSESAIDPVSKPAPELTIVGAAETVTIPVAAEHAGEVVVGHSIETTEGVRLSFSPPALLTGDELRRQQHMAEGKYE